VTTGSQVTTPGIPCILTIAGSDSGGGAGIQADLKTIAALGGYGSCVLTALTAQNGLGVTGIHAPEPEFAALQLTTVLEGFPVAAAKTGMLFSAPVIEALAPILRKVSFPLVVDPVCVSKSGHQLLREDAVSALVREVLPLATLVTPNRPEAELLANMSVTTPEDAEEAARRILKLGPQAVLIKGGHFQEDNPEPELTDWLVLPHSPPLALPTPRINTPETHGTGCTLSAAIATGLGFGLDMVQAVRKAQAYLNACLRGAFNPGLGVGPADHMARLRPFITPPKE
jgi:hydroxymethylpyrimidine/phosphomethylpyrimidine kinase